MTDAPPNGGLRVAAQGKETHPLICLRVLTETGNSRVTQMGKGADLGRLTETGNSIPGHSPVSQQEG